MWTYLMILLSLLAILAVFIHRIYAMRKAKRLAAKPVADEEELPEIEEKDLSKAEASQIEELCRRGESLLRAGKEDEAIKVFVQALAIDAYHIETQNKLAMLYMQKRMFSAAAALFKQMGDITEDSVHYSHLGLALYNQNDFEGAREAYHKAVVLDPARPQRFASLAQVYRGLGEFNNAIIALNKAFELDAENISYMFLLAGVQLEAGNFEEARSVINKILDLDPANEEALAFLKTIRAAEKEVGEEKA